MACLEPQVGNIRLTDGTLIGYRDPDTGVFTPDAAFPDVEFIVDKSCNTSCNITVYNNGVIDINEPFVFNFATGEWEPAIGALTLREDIVETTLDNVVDLRDGTTRTLKGLVYVDSASTPEGFDVVWELGNSGITSTSIQLAWQLDTLTGYWTGDTTGLLSNTGPLAIAPNTWCIVEMIVSDTEFTIIVDGVSKSAASILAGATTVNEIHLGARDEVFRNLPVDYEWFSHEMGGVASDELSTVTLEGRLWGVNDANGNKFFGTAGDEWVLIDNSPLGAPYPHIGKWDGTLSGAHLVNDKYQTDTVCVTVNPDGDFNYPDFNPQDFKV